jgi:hypothetical protein
MLLAQPTVGSAKFATIVVTPSPASAVATSEKIRISPEADWTASPWAASFPRRSPARTSRTRGEYSRTMPSVPSDEQSEATRTSRACAG